jgi:hypothetical protein
MQWPQNSDPEGQAQKVNADQQAQQDARILECVTSEGKGGADNDGSSSRYPLRYPPGKHQRQQKNKSSETERDTRSERAVDNELNEDRIDCPGPGATIQKTRPNENA